jgi:hypothetical protein
MNSVLKYSYFQPTPLSLFRSSDNDGEDTAKGPKIRLDTGRIWISCLSAPKDDNSHCKSYVYTYIVTGSWLDMGFGSVIECIEFL